MKRLFFYLLPCLLLATLVGCTDESAGNEPGQPGAPEAFRLAVRVPGSSIASRAAGATETGSDYENRINTFSLFVFEEKKGTGGATDTICLFCQRIDLTQPSAETGGWVTDGSDETLKNMTIPISASAGWENLPLDVSATYHFYLLANVPEDNDPALPHKEAPADITVGLLRSMQLQGSARLLNLNDETPPPSNDAAPLNAIPMAGYSKVAKLSPMMEPIAVELARMVAKVRYTVQASPEFEAEYAPVLNTAQSKVWLTQSAKEGYLLDGWMANNLPAPAVDRNLNLTATNIPVAASTSGWFYVYENLPGNSLSKPAQPTVFKLSVPTLKNGLSGTQLYTIPVNDSLAIQRNTIYDMQIVLQGPGQSTIDNVKINTEILPWGVLKSEQECGINMTLQLLSDKFPDRGVDTLLDLPVSAPLVYLATVISSENCKMSWYWNDEELRDREGISITSTTSQEGGGYKIESKLTILRNRPDHSGYILCIALGNRGLQMDRESWVSVRGVSELPKEAPTMQNWKAPRNVKMGTSCLVRDERDDKIYRVRLMRDGQWWMIESLHYWPEELTQKSVSDYITAASSSQYDTRTGLYGTCYSDGALWLYNFEAATQIALKFPLAGMTGNGPAGHPNHIQGLCPDGWHLPTLTGEGNIQNPNVFTAGLSEWTDLVTAVRPYAYSEFLGYSFRELEGDFASQAGYIATGIVQRDASHYFSSCQAAEDGAFRALRLSNLLLSNQRESVSLSHEKGASIRCIRNYK